MKKRLLAVLLVVAMVASMLMGCSSGTEEAAEDSGGEGGGDGSYTIGCTVYYMTEFITLMVEGMEEKAEELGCDLVMLDAQNVAQMQITQVENLIAQNVDVIVVAAVDSDAIVPALEMCENADIPLVGVNMLINTEEEYHYVGPDDVLAGELEMQHAIDAIGGEGNVVILEGPIGQSAQIQRL